MTSDDFDKFYSERNGQRFFMRDTERCYHGGIHKDAVDRVTGRVIGNDCGEPEDRMLVRDLAWVLDELNNLSKDQT
jgi:hypothetical protein